MIQPSSIQHKLVGASLKQTLLAGLALWLTGLLIGWFDYRIQLTKELNQQAEQILQNLIIHPAQVDHTQLDWNYTRLHSGYYYVIFNRQTQFLPSPSLGNFEFILPERKTGESLLFHHPGPNNTQLTVYFTDYRIDHQWFDIAVAKANPSGLPTHLLAGLVYSLMVLLIFLTLILAQRRFVKQTLQQQQQLWSELKENQIQSHVLAGAYPSEIQPMANRLHQTQVAMRALSELYHDKHATQVNLPSDLEPILAEYKKKHPLLHFELKTELSPQAIVILESDFKHIVSALLDNACEWTRTEVRLDLSYQKHKLCLVVEDNGRDLSVERLSQIQHMNLQSTGTLTRVRLMIQAYNGMIHFAKSESLGGLKVSVYFESFLPEQQAC